MHSPIWPGPHSMHSPVEAADRLFGLDVELHQADVEAPAQPLRRPADRAFPAVEIKDRDVALGRAVELQDLRDAEAAQHHRPDVGPQAVAEGQPELVTTFVLVLGLVGQIAAELADVDEHGGAFVGHLGPELAGREPGLQDHRAAVEQRGAHGAEPAGGVIERQGHVDAVAGPGVGRPGEAPQVELGPHVGDARGLRQAGGAAGENQQRQVAGGHALADAAVGGELAAALQGLTEVAPIAGRLAQHPELGRLVQQRPAGFEGRGGLVVDDAVRGAGEIQAVRQRPAGQMVVDQRGDHADLGEAVPDREIFQPVRHEQRHRLAAPDMQALGPVGEAVGDRVELAVGDGAPLEAEGRPRAVLLDRALQVVAEQIGR
jgi:hypothetical protein